MTEGTTLSCQSFLRWSFGVLLFVVSAISPACADDVIFFQEPPDKYRWPFASVFELKADPKYPVAKLTKAQREELRSVKSYGQDLPETIDIMFADLDRDGRDELFIYCQPYSGTGGSFYFIYAPSKDGMKCIGGVQGGIRLMESPNKWLQIESISRGGGGYYSRNLLRYLDGEYRMVRNEIHNTYKKTVEVMPCEYPKTKGKRPW